MKLLSIFFLILSSTLFAQWQLDESFPSLPSYTLYYDFFHPTPDTLIVIEDQVPPPPPYIENMIIYVKDIRDTTWSMIYNGTNIGFTRFYQDSKLAFAAGLFLSKSTDGGISWQIMHDFRNEFPNGSASDVYFKDEQNGYVTGGDDSQGFFGKSQDGGINWDFKSISGNMFCRNLVMTNDSTFFITGLPNGGYERIYKSTDYGSTWIVKNNNTFNAVLKLYFWDEENGWALGTQGKILKTTDAGESWQDVSSGSWDDYRDCIFFSQNIGWVAGSKNGYDNRPLIRTSDGGATWQNSLDVPDIVHVLFINPDTGYVMTKYQIYKTTNGGGFPTESNSESRNLKGFNLSQNYPNPFNPVSTIEYEIPAQGYITLKIYDVLGNEVAILVNADKPSGTYSVKFDGSNLPSGIYLYQLKYGSYIATKKLLLLK